MSKFARRKDASHAPIVADLEHAGLIVFDVASVPSLGFDIVVYNPRSQKWGVAELKSDKSVHHKSDASRVTPAEQKAARRAPIPIAATSDEALKLFR